MRSLRIIVLFGLVGHFLQGMASPAAPGRLIAEMTAYAQSGNYSEVVRFCRDLEKAHPSAAKCTHMGASAQGRDIKALVVQNRRLGRSHGQAATVAGVVGDWWHPCG